MTLSSSIFYLRVWSSVHIRSLSDSAHGWPNYVIDDVASRTRRYIWGPFTGLCLRRGAGWFVYWLIPPPPRTAPAPGHRNGLSTGNERICNIVFTLSTCRHCTRIEF